MRRGIIAFAFLIALLSLTTVIALPYAATNMTVYVINSAPVIIMANITPNVTEPEDILFLRANVTDPNGVPADIASVIAVLNNGTANYATVTLTYNSLTGFYENNTFQLPLTTRPFGTHTANFTATDDFALFDWYVYYFNVTDATAPVIYYVNATPQYVDPGNSVNITANVSDNVQVNTVWVSINGTNYTMTLYVGDDLDGGYYFDGFDTTLPAGQYNFTVYANDTFGNLAFNDTGYFFINAQVAISLTNTPIDFGNTTIPVTDRRADNGTISTLQGYDGNGLIEGFPLVINNTGNVYVNLSISGTNLTGLTTPSYQIPVGAVAYNTTMFLSGTPLTLSDVEFAANVPGLGTATDLFFWISIPTGYISQYYQGVVNITAVQS